MGETENNTNKNKHMTFRIPDKDKRFSVDNSSFSRGNVYGTWNFMADADAGKIKLQHPLGKLYSTTDNADFVKTIGIVLGQKNGGGGVDCYVANEKTNGTGYVWSVGQGSLTKLTGTNAPTKISDASSDICLAFKSGSDTTIVVSDADGLHTITDSASAAGWNLYNNSGFKSKFIIKYFQEQNRIYLFDSTSMYSADQAGITANTPTVSGSYTHTNLVGVSCAAVGSRRIWIGTKGGNNVPECMIYESDGVSANPMGIHKIPTSGIQSIAMNNDIPEAIDMRGRIWYWDGYQFVLKQGMNLPVREDDFSTVCTVHRNGSFAEGGKAYFLIGGGGTNGQNSSERGIAGVWCHDQNIGFYHFSSPDNNARFGSSTGAYALSKYTSDKTMVAGYWGSSSSTTGEAKLAVTETTGGLGGTLRRGYFITQFMESLNITDMINSITTKYREVIDTTNFKIEVKYRKKKGLECNTTITWTSATTFTCSTADLAGTGTYYNSQVAVGDEVMVQFGTNAGIIAHIVSMVDNSGTTTVTIDRSVSTTSGTAYAMISNFKLLGTIDKDNPDKTFKNFRLGEKSTMIQVKVVMSWKGYFDELQEILVGEQVQDKLI